MALKTVVDDLNTVPEPFRKEYELKDGKYHLSLDGAPAGFSPSSELAAANGKIVEFRENNIKLTKELETARPVVAAFEGVDPKAAKDALAKVTELGKKGVTKADDVSQLVADGIAAALGPVNEKLQATEKREREAQDRANKATLRTVVGEAFTKAGGKGKALDFILGQAESAFEVVDGKVVAKANKFSAANPGNPLDVAEWLGGQVKENDFAFEPSNGGGANPRNNGNSGGARPGQTVLRDPDARQLGAAADDIAAGKVRVEYSNQ